LVIATVPSIGEESIEQYSSFLYEKWKIGAEGKDEGVLILLSMEQRKIRIEVGYGAEGYLNDSKTGRLLDNYCIPYFKKGDYSGGMLSLAVALAKEVEKEKGIALSMPVNQYRPDYEQEVQLSPVQLIFILIALVLLLSTRFGRSLLFWILVSSMSGSGRRRGGFGSGFGGGGYGGFGGGMSGGGGSSRSF